MTALNAAAQMRPQPTATAGWTLMSQYATGFISRAEAKSPPQYEPGCPARVRTISNTNVTSGGRQSHIRCGLMDLRRWLENPSLIPADTSRRQAFGSWASG